MIDILADPSFFIIHPATVVRDGLDLLCLFPFVFLNQFLLCRRLFFRSIGPRVSGDNLIPITVHDSGLESRSHPYATRCHILLAISEDIMMVVSGSHPWSPGRCISSPNLFPSFLHKKQTVITQSKTKAYFISHTSTPFSYFPLPSSYNQGGKWKSYCSNHYNSSTI